MIMILQSTRYSAGIEREEIQWGIRGAHFLPLFTQSHKPMTPIHLSVSRPYSTSIQKLYRMRPWALDSRHSSALPSSPPLPPTASMTSLYSFHPNTFARSRSQTSAQASSYMRSSILRQSFYSVKFRKKFM